MEVLEENLDLPGNSLKFEEVFEAAYISNKDRYPDDVDPGIFGGLVPSEVFDKDVVCESAREVIGMALETKEQLRIMIALEVRVDYLGPEYDSFLNTLKNNFDLAKLYGVLVLVLQLDFIEAVIEDLEDYSSRFN